jgi:hypothetical protein
VNLKWHCNNLSTNIIVRPKFPFDKPALSYESFELFVFVPSGMNVIVKQLAVSYTSGMNVIATQLAVYYPSGMNVTVKQLAVYYPSCMNVTVK